MKLQSVVCTLVVLVSAAAAWSQDAAAGLTSKKERGTVSLATDPVLNDGRLIFKVVAFNASAQPASLSSGQIKVFTSQGKEVDTESLAELIAAVRGEADRSQRRSSTHQPSDYSRQSPSTGARGQIDISGGIRPGSDAATHAATDAPRGAAPADAEATQRQIEALKGAVLQDVTVAPGQAAGGQVVTSKLKFARKEPRTLRVTVGFNGEQHEFSFETPPEK